MNEPGPSAAGGTCPRCSRTLPRPLAETGSKTTRWPHYPFCSDRCRLIDLGKWMDGKYIIPGDPTDPTSPAQD